MEPGPRITQLSSDGIPQVAATKFAAVVARVVRAPTALILLADGDQLKMAGSSGLPGEWSQVGTTPAKQTLAGLVVSDDRPVVIADIADDPRVPPDTPAVLLGVHGYAGFPIRDPAGRIVGVLAVVDLRPRVWTPDELAVIDDAAQACGAFVAVQCAHEQADTEHRFLDALLQSLRVAVAACDADGKVIFTNAAARRLAGSWPPERDLDELARHTALVDARGVRVPPEELPLIRALAGETLRDVWFRAVMPGQEVTSDGETRTISADAQPILGPQGNRLGAVACVRDVTDERRANELAVALECSKDDYLTLIGHELRTPLTSITAYLDLLRDLDPATAAEELPDILDVLGRNSATLRHIVDELLDLAGIDNGLVVLADEPVDLTATVTAAVRAAEPAAAAAGVTLTLDACPDALVRGDQRRLRQVADHLLANAVNHSTHEGEVTVELGRPVPSVVELIVTDNGIGVPGDDRERVFARFCRSERTREHRLPGNGLGLTISRAIVERHHGSIRFVPGPAPGARIAVRLPAPA
jgi:two-component system phosphate regulon sensor histidine kinase PhoR